MKDRLKKYVEENKKELAIGIAIGVYSGLLALAGYHYGSSSVGVDAGGPCGTNEEGQRQFMVCLDNGKDIVFTEPKQ